MFKKLFEHLTMQVCRMPIALPINGNATVYYVDRGRRFELRSIIGSGGQEIRHGRDLVFAEQMLEVNRLRWRMAADRNAIEDAQRRIAENERKLERVLVTLEETKAGR